ncbi:MAG: response regulator [Nitrospira sp.]|nr:response regulator [Nitrospira sp.]MDH5725883.1 response regulator [Nitrospira sp.]
MTRTAQSVPSQSVPVDVSPLEYQKGVSILVAEDNPVNREAAAEMLEVEGYHVHTVCNGREAVEAVASQTIDVVFMDCQMPVMDGFTATAAIRAREKELGLPRVPIVALTAHAITGDRERCLAHDMDDYLSKPFRQAQLIAVVRRWVSEGRSVAGSTPEVTGSDGSAVAVVGESVNCLDEGTLQDLRALRRPGRRDPYVGMLTRYLDSSREYLATIYQNIDAQDATGLAQTTHSLKSSSAMVGAMTLAEHVKKLEAIARSGNLSVAQTAFAQVEQEYHRVSRAIEGLLGKEAA